ncbi:hypothetical protein ACIHDR_48215 [Nocardia sp. NPDC052278]|uniref:hypothetical protein n=1 Tax=unclassified Nocardia TaxID=2637762 RepID=UPI0036B79676
MPDLTETIESPEIVPARIVSRPTWDAKDYKLVHIALQARRRLTGPQVGDWIDFADRPLRISHMWGDYAAQTELGSGSIYLIGSGHGSYSGSLYSSVPVSELTATEEYRPSRMWIFHHGWARAHHGVHFTIPTRVYTCSLTSPQY